MSFTTLDMGKLIVDFVCEDEELRPAYANETDACMDLRIKAPRNGKVITPGSTAVFGTGLQAKIPEGYVMLIYPRSSTGFKLSCRFANSTAVIDSGYRDEIKLAIHNFGKYSVTLENLQRVAQFIILPYPKIVPCYVKDDECFRHGDRGGGIGSTGRKEIK